MPSRDEESLLGAAALKAMYERDLEIKRSGFLAETQQAKAEAAQSGPLAEARASKKVIEEQTELAQRQADLAGRRLEAEVRRPADAEAYRMTTIAAAAAEATKTRADAAAYAERAKANADADANSAVAASLKGGNQELIAASRLVENLPSLVTAAADGIADANLTIFNGADGVSQIIAGLVGQGMSILDTLKKSTTTGRTEAVEPSADGAAALPPPAGNGAASPAPPPEATKN